MNAIDLNLFTACLPAVKIDWLNRLRNEPSLSALGRSETVEFLMDATLAQLRAGLTPSGKDRGFAQLMPVALIAHRYCACASEPITRYYATGEEALRTALSPAFGEARDVVIKKFRTTFDFEIAAMCAVCPHPDWQGCGRPKKPAAEPRK